MARFGLPAPDVAQTLWVEMTVVRQPRVRWICGLAASSTNAAWEAKNGLTCASSNQ